MFRRYDVSRRNSTLMERRPWEIMIDGYYRGDG